MKVPNYIGTLENGKHLELPEDAITQGFAFMGKRGKGKSNLLGVFLEILLSRGQSFVCLDPPAAHWGIRYAAGPDGRPMGPSGFDVLIIGGAHGDIPIEQTNGREAARIIVDGDISAVVDMKAMGFSERQKWCADFAEELFKINTTPRMIAFEEAHNFLPQQLKFDEQKRVSYAMGKLIEEGRGSGLGYVIASQKTQKVNKDQLTQVDNFFALGMIGPQDIDQVEGWFKHHIRDKEKLQDVMDDLPKMKAGECWALSPEWLGEITKFNARLRVTYHAGRTPKPGEREVNVSKFSVTDAVKKLRELFAVKQTEVRKDAATLKEANATIRRLESELRKKDVPQGTKNVPVVDQRAIDRAVKLATKDGSETLRLTRNQLHNVQSVVGSVVEKLKLITQLKDPVSITYEVSAPAPTTPVRHADVTPPVTRPTREPAPEGSITIKKKAREMLHELSVYDPAPRSRKQLGAAVALPTKGSTFTGYLSNLRLSGYISESGELVSITPAGRAFIGEPRKSVATTEDMLALWRPRFKAKARLMLDYLIMNYPNFITREALAERVEIPVKGSTFTGYLSNIRLAGLLEERGEEVKASDSLFP